MIQVTVREAKAHLLELIDLALAGEEVVIAKGDRPLVKLVVLPKAAKERRLGGAAAVIISMADDFDEPPDEFADYMT